MKNDADRDGPPVYFDARGVSFVKPAELVRSGAFRRALEATRRIFAKPPCGAESDGGHYRCEHPRGHVGAHVQRLSQSSAVFWGERL